MLLFSSRLQYPPLSFASNISSLASLSPSRFSFLSFLSRFPFFSFFSRLPFPSRLSFFSRFSFLSFLSRLPFPSRLSFFSRFSFLSFLSRFPFLSFLSRLPFPLFPPFPLLPPFPPLASVPSDSIAWSPFSKSRYLYSPSAILSAISFSSRHSSLVIVFFSI